MRSQTDAEYLRHAETMVEFRKAHDVEGRKMPGELVLWLPPAGGGTVEPLVTIWRSSARRFSGN